VQIEPLQPGRLDAASSVLASAFMDDPAWRWILPDEARRRRLLPWLFRAGFEIADADVWTTQGEIVGVARWLPPGRSTMRIAPALRVFVATPLRLGSATGRFFAYGRAVEGLRAQAAPWPHWYLAGIGVDPSAQRRGVGTALLQPGIEGSQRDGLPAVLLTNSERNLTFYERSGFRIVDEGETPEGGPHAWAMVRDP
jgi:ribosomal protein S18 acetylase RimI-like enzyme